jgi:hypothetical protein
MADRQLSTRDLAETSEEGNLEQNFEEGRPGENGPEASAQVETASSEADSPDSGVDEAGREPLLPGDQSERFTSQWQDIQASFVDRPRESVEQADALVADLMQRLAAGFSEERERLEAQWDSGDDVSTEDLRVALTRYRSFFDRLLAA